mmetsp:Transcript_25887/g.70191  ORF Transcript_25887/g.70191 Transcript_25887/m.70191 type:complete len:197 (+) Transcript_25887:817-1407(+)
MERRHRHSRVPLRQPMQEVEQSVQPRAALRSARIGRRTTGRQGIRGGSSRAFGEGVEEGWQPGLGALPSPLVQLPQLQHGSIEFGGDLTRSSSEEQQVGGGQARAAPAAGKGARKRARGGALSALMSAAVALSGDSALPDDQACVICLSAPRQIGYLHGNSVHLSACKECANRLACRGSGTCPICRSPSTMVNVYV